MPDGDMTVEEGGGWGVIRGGKGENGIFSRFQLGSTIGTPSRHHDRGIIFMGHGCLRLICKHPKSQKCHNYESGLRLTGSGSKNRFGIFLNKIYPILF